MIDQFMLHQLAGLHGIETNKMCLSLRPALVWLCSQYSNKEHPLTITPNVIMLKDSFYTKGDNKQNVIRVNVNVEEKKHIKTVINKIKRQILKKYKIRLTSIESIFCLLEDYIRNNNKELYSTLYADIIAK